MKPEADSLTRVKMWAMALAAPNVPPSVRRRAMYSYLGALYGLAMEAEPTLRPLVGSDGMVITKAMAEMQEALRQASNREVPALFGEVFKATGGGRPPKARSEQLCWASAAAVITIIMRECAKTEEEAAKLVEKHLRHKGIHVPSTSRANAPAWKRLQSLRDKIIAGNGGKFAKAYYDDALRFGAFNEPPYTPQQWMDFLLDPPFVAYEPFD